MERNGKGSSLLPNCLNKGVLIGNRCTYCLHVLPLEETWRKGIQKYGILQHECTLP